MHEDALLKQQLEEIIKNKRGCLFRPPEENDVVIMASGGLDSSVTIDLIIQKWDVKVHPLFAKRGSRAEEFEEISFDFFCRFYKERYPENFMSPFKIKEPIPPESLKAYYKKESIELLGHPMRDSGLQNMGVQYAVYLNERYGLDVKTVFSSMSPDEEYPHSSLTALRAQTILTCIDRGDWSWQLTSPLLEPVFGKQLYKADLILWARDNKIPLEKTRTCISSTERADGTCPECLLRLKAFKSAGVADPVEYEK